MTEGVKKRFRTSWSNFSSVASFNWRNFGVSVVNKAGEAMFNEEEGVEDQTELMQAHLESSKR